MNKKVVLSFSGGLDSTALLSLLIHRGYEVIPVFFQYGSVQNKEELGMVNAMAQYYDVTVQVIDLTSVFQRFSSSLLDGSVPESHYRDVEAMNQNYVPARNIIFASILAGMALTHKASEIALGVHKVGEGEAIYPDSRKDFIKALDLALYLGTATKVSVITPLDGYTKPEVVQLGVDGEVPFEFTYSCYRGGKYPCGVCGTCVERLEAFKIAGVEDPVEYGEKI